MGTAKLEALRGLITLPARLTAALAPRDGTPQGSSYSEAAPRPGGSRAVNPGTFLRPEVSGDQVIDAELAITRGGNPSEIDGAAVQLRAAGAPITSYTGWSPPHWISAWSALTFTGVPPPFDEWDAVTRVESQEVVAVLRRGGGLAEVFVLHPEDGPEWTSLGNVPGTAGAGSLALVELPSGRILLFDGPSTVRSTDDGGITWALYSDSTGIVGGGRSSMAVDRGLVSFFDESSGGSDIGQWVSRDLGVTFELVELAVAVGLRPEVRAIPGGGLAMAFEGSGALNTVVVVLEDATQPVSLAQVVIVDAGVLTGQLGLHIDADGIFFVYGRTANDEVACYRSTDGGVTWIAYLGGVANLQTGLASVSEGRAYGMQGYAVWLHQWTGAATVNIGALGSFILGGSENLEAGGSDIITVPGNVIDRAGFGAPLGLTWYPLAHPDALGWTQLGTTSSGFLAAPGQLEIVTSAQTDYYERLLGASLGAAVIFQFRGPLGGSTFVPDVGLTLRVANGAAEYRVNFNWGAQNFGIFDDVSNTIVDSTETPGFLAKIEVMIRINPGGQLATAWRFQSELDAVTSPWTHGPAGGLANAGAGAAQSRIQFGHILGAGNLDSDWSLVAVTTDAGGLVNLPGTVAPQLGKRLGGLFPYPWPGVGSRARSARLALRSGPAPVLETFELEAAHDHPIAHLFPDLSPNPTETWRDDDEAGVEQVIAFDLGENTRIGETAAMALGILNNNFQTAHLEVETSPAVWLTLGTWNGAEGFEGLNFGRDGDVLIPSLGGLAGRYLQRNELAGGVAISGGVAKRIRSHAAGRWGAANPTAVPFLHLEDSAGFPGAGADLVLVAPRGVLFFYVSDYFNDFWRRFRVRIPGQLTPDPYKEAGLLFLGGFSPFGQQWSRGWSQQMRPNVERRRSPAGVIRKRQLGKPAIRWSMAWPDGVKLSETREVESPDYLAPRVAGFPGNPLVNEQDVWTQLFALVEETRGGELPVIAVGAAPNDIAGNTGMITDRTLFLYGTLDGSPQFNQVVGDEGVDEFGRVEGISVDGIQG